MADEDANNLLDQELARAFGRLGQEEEEVAQQNGQEEREGRMNPFGDEMAEDEVVDAELGRRVRDIVDRMDAEEEERLMARRRAAEEEEEALFLAEIARILPGDINLAELRGDRPVLPAHLDLAELRGVQRVLPGQLAFRPQQDLRRAEQEMGRIFPPGGRQAAEEEEELFLADLARAVPDDPFLADMRRRRRLAAEVRERHEAREAMQRERAAREDERRLRDNLQADAHRRERLRQILERKKGGRRIVTDEMIAAAVVMRAEDEKSDPSPLGFSRLCSICDIANPRQRAVYSQCGHVICYPCAVEIAKRPESLGKCSSCNSSSTFVKLFEDEEKTDPSPLRFSRLCHICNIANPRQRAVYSQCGHVICYPCAVEIAKRAESNGKCPSCNSSSTFVKLFEDEEKDVNDEKK